MARNIETKTQMLRRANLRRDDKGQGTAKPYFGFVKEYNAAADTTLVDSHGGRRIMFNPQPHLGRSAWMRAAPEGGMGTLLVTRSDTKEPENLRWWHTDTKLRLQLFRENVDSLLSGSGQLISREAFRPLQSGEIDIVSRGGAQIFMGNRPHLDMRAGIMRFTMDQDETEISSKAPIHVRQNHQYISSEIGDEERFGVVKRPDAGSTIDKFYPDPDGKRDNERVGFAKEHLMRMTNPQLTPPRILFDTRTGHVIDDSGIPYRLEDTGEKLRARSEYFTTAETSVLLQLDELGNFKIEHPVEATSGGKFILPTGSLVVEIGTTKPADFKRFIGRNEEAFILADRREFVGNNSSEIVDKNRTLVVHADEVRVIDVDADETVGRDKIIRVGRNFLVEIGPVSLTGATGATGSHSNLNFTEAETSFETETLTILATKEIIFESPLITFNAPVVNFTGVVRSEGGFRSNSTNVAPSSSRGRAGSIPTKTAIRVNEAEE